MIFGTNITIIIGDIRVLMSKFQISRMLMINYKCFGRAQGSNICGKIIFYVNCFAITFCRCDKSSLFIKFLTFVCETLQSLFMIPIK